MKLSAALHALLEWPVHSYPGFQDFLSLLEPALRPPLEAMVHACMKEGTPFESEVALRTASGRQLWLRMAGAAQRAEGRALYSAQGVLQDLTGKKLAEQESLGVTMRLSTTLASIAEAFATLDRDGRFSYLNRECEELLERKSAALLGTTLWTVMDAARGEFLQAGIQARLSTGPSVEFEEFYQPGDGAQGKWLALRAYPFEDGFAVYLRDVTAQRAAQEQLLLLQTSISRLNDIVLITDASPLDPPGPRIVFANDAFERLTGYSQAEVLGRTPRLLQGRRTQRSELDRIRLALEQSSQVRAELINYKKNGELFWMELDIVPVDYFQRGVTHWVAVGRDITQRKVAEDEIEHLAFYDALTQLPNRQLLMDRLGRVLAQGAVVPEMGALMFIDLDNFKVLNDTLGHAKGDVLLQQVALRLGTCVRLGDTVARLGGDEFVVLLEELGDNEQDAIQRSRKVADKILAVLSEPYELAGHPHHCTCSIGVTSFGTQRASMGDLLKQADLAMYQAKAQGRNAVCFFDPAMQAVATASAALNGQLRQGLRNEEFVLHFQPQVGREGKMCGAEALLRWQHPEHGLVQPDEFIEQAEESGLILPLGQWALESACQQLARWAAKPQTQHLSISVNVSARQFRHPEFVDLVMAVIARTGIPAHQLKLELTETLLASDMEVTIAKMGVLKEAGVTLSIDDFGMGYS
ncbi:MAG: diguanylate cyclase, partial [Polaromonas sp.]|nr:diguanylate cyclase [Polaromonas sp.]